MNNFNLNSVSKIVIDFEINKENNFVGFLLESREARNKFFIRISTMKVFYKEITQNNIDQQLTFRPFLLSIFNQENHSTTQYFGILSTDKALYIYKYHCSAIQQIATVSLISSSPLIDLFFVSSKSFVTLSVDEALTLYNFKFASSCFQASVKTNFNEQKQQYSFFLFNSKNILLSNEREHLIISFEKLLQKKINLDSFLEAQKKINLFDFLEDNSWFKKQLNAVVRNTTDKQKTKRKSKRDSFEIMIDESVQEKFTNSKQERKNRFEFVEKVFLIIISQKEYTLDLFDFTINKKYQLNICFKALFIVLSPFRYKENEHYFLFYLVLVFGFKEMLGFSFFLEKKKKIFKSRVFINDFEYCIEKAIFLDPYRIVIQNEIGKVNILTFDQDIFGKTVIQN